MTLQQLEYITAVDRLRHFGRAAEFCGVTQPTLSAMVQKIETELGVKIFDRNVQPVATTPVGSKIVEQAWRVIGDAAKINDIIDEERQSTDRTFRIGILPTIAPYLLPRFFPQLLAEHPGLDLRIVEMKTAEIKSELSKGTLDAAILVRTDGMDDFAATTLFYEQFLAYVAKGDTLYDSKCIRAADLTDEFLWLLGEGHCFRDQMMKFCELQGAVNSTTTYSLGSIETFMRMVESGKGITFIPELALEQLSQAQRALVRPFAIPIPVREVIMLTTQPVVHRSMLQLLIDSVRRSVPRAMLRMNNTQQRI